MRIIIDWVENVKCGCALSLRELENARHLAMQAMLLGMHLVLNLFTAVPIGGFVRISFGYLAVATTGALLGPIPAMINGALADVLGYFIKPMGAYHPGFTLSGLLGGLFYGIAFYKKRPIRLMSILLVKLAVDVIINLGLNTLWLYQLRGLAVFAQLPARLGKNLLQYPVDVVLLLSFFKALERARGKTSMF